MQIPCKFQFWGSDLSNELHILKNKQNRSGRILGINFSSWNIRIFLGHPNEHQESRMSKFQKW